MSRPPLQTLHSWDVTPKQAIQIQLRLASLVHEETLRGRVRTVAGVDCAFFRDTGRVIVVGVLCSVPDMTVLEESRCILPCTFPYVPGLLSFREAPAVIKAVEGFSDTPDLLMCDSQGRAHPRRFGLACHVGVWLQLPTIGVAKNRLCGSHCTPGQRRGCRTQLRLDSEVVGMVVRTRTNVKPVYVSTGQMATLKDAVRWTLRCARGYRLPEPTRQAHLRVTRWKKTLRTVEQAK